jgi:hypothetical protein
MNKNRLRPTNTGVPKRKPISVIEREHAQANGAKKAALTSTLIKSYTRQLAQEQKVAQRICDRLNINLPTLEEVQKQIKSKKNPTQSEINLFILITNMATTKKK